MGLELDLRLAFVALIVTVLGIGLTILWPTKKIIGHVCLSLAGILFLVWIGLEIRAYLHPRTFVVHRGVVVSSEVFDGSQIWMAYNTANGGAISPVHYALCTTLTNAKSTPSMISTLSVEVFSSSTWVPMTRVNEEQGFLYWTTDLKNISSIAFNDPFLWRQISNRTIGAGESVHGWILYAAPAGYDTFPKPQRFRLRLVDSTDLETITSLDGAGKGNVGGCSWKLIPAQVDMSRFVVRPYGQQ